MVEPILGNQLSSQMWNRSPIDAIKKNPKSCQPKKIDHVENGLGG